MALRRLEHVLVLTDDLDASKSFYCEALGLEVGERPPLEFPGYWLYVDGVPCLHLAERAAYEAHAATLGLAVGPAVDHLAFGSADFEHAAERLKAAGVEAIANEVPQAGLRQLFVTDPNGVRIELNLPA